MVRQYIGARYVPKFFENSDNTAEWRAGVIYEPLTIVTYNGNSYTSKKTVPAEIGNPSSNPSYWAATGLYSEQVELLRQQVEILQSDVNDIQEDVDDINASWTHPKTVIITDSYGSSAFPNVTNFCLRFANYGGYTIGENFDYSHYDGAGFVSDGRTFDTPLNAIYSRLTGDMSPEKIERVLILGGCNDALTSIDNILVGMNTIIQHTKTDFPNAVIYVGCIGGLKNNRTGIYRNSANAYSRCSEFGAYFLPNLEFVMMNDVYFQTDGIHPNQDGMNAIAKAVLNAIEKGYTDRPIRNAGTATLDSTWTEGSVSFVIEGYNNQISAVIRTDPALRCEARNITGNCLIGTLENNLINGTAETVFPVYGIIGTTGGSVPLNSYAIILNKTLYVVFPTAVSNVNSLIIFRSRADLMRGLC